MVKKVVRINKKSSYSTKSERSKKGSRKTSKLSRSTRDEIHTNRDEIAKDNKESPKSNVSKDGSLLLIWKNFKIVLFPILLYMPT